MSCCGDAVRVGTSAHLGANADLAAVTREIMLIVHLLDRITQVRFRKNSVLLAAWKSARAGAECRDRRASGVRRPAVARRAGTARKGDVPAVLA
jgi:hypothetical protein